MIHNVDPTKIYLSALSLLLLVFACTISLRVEAYHVQSQNILRGEDGNPDVIEWDEYTIVGSCKILEKHYLRLTSVRKDDNFPYIYHSVLSLPFFCLTFLSPIFIFLPNIRFATGSGSFNRSTLGNFERFFCTFEGEVEEGKELSLDL